MSFLDTADLLFKEWVVDNISAVIFFDLAFWDNGQSGEVVAPAVVCWLAAAACFFTLRFRFVNVRGFRHGTEVVRGLYTRADDKGEISPFQALAAALSATVGLGNIAGVATAIDAIDPQVRIEFEDEIEGEDQNCGTILRTWIATDASGNRATCVQRISRLE